MFKDLKLIDYKMTVIYNNINIAETIQNELKKFREESAEKASHFVSSPIYYYELGKELCSNSNTVELKMFKYI